MADRGLWPTFSSALQAAAAVLLDIFYGVLVGHFEVMDDRSVTQMSKLCVQVFLPALLVTDVGSQLNPENVAQYAAIVVWAMICNLSTLGVSMVLQRLLQLPTWTTMTITFNNTLSLPLLLTQTLAETGVLNGLLRSEHDTVDAALQRAQSYFLVSALCSNVLTFTLGPRILKSPGASFGPDYCTNAIIEDVDGVANEPTEEAPLLPQSVVDPGADTNRKPSTIGRSRFEPLSMGLRHINHLIYSLLNPALLGGILGAILGLVPPLRRVFFNRSQDGGIFNAWLISSIQNIGQLFAALQIIVCGVRLSRCLRRMSRGEDSGQIPLLGATITLAIRFAIWPIISIGTIYFFNSRTSFLAGDPVLIFAMMLMPCGPTAMNLTSLTDVSGSPEEDKLGLAKFLTISYAVSPLLAFAVVGSLKATQSLQM